MAAWAVALTLTIIIFVAVHAVILPVLFLRADYGSAFDGRGIKKIEDADGQAIVYEPDAKSQKYIKQYALLERDGKKLLVCKIDDGVKYIEFDAVVYGSDGKVIKALCVKQVIQRAGYTEEVELPEATSYLSVTLCAANGKIYPKRRAGKIKIKKLAAFIALSCVTDILAVLAVKVCCAKLFGGLFGESFLTLPKSWAITCGICVCVIALDALFTALTAYLGNGGRLKKEADDAGL